MNMISVREICGIRVRLIFIHTGEPPVSCSAEIVYTDDTEKNIHAWAADQADYAMVVKTSGAIKW